NIGAGAGPTDTAEARCAFILQAAPAGVDLGALAACIGAAAAFQEAYRRCVEMLRDATRTPAPCPSGVGAGRNLKQGQPACLEPTATPTRPAAPTVGPCGRFSIAGEWRASQANGYAPTFAFTQSGSTITGTATLSASDQARAGFRSPTGAIAGSLVGAALDFTVTWQGANGPITGRYTATVVPS